MKYRYLRKCYEKTTKKLQLYYGGLQVCRLQVTTGHYRSLQVTTVTTGTTGFVRKSQGLLMRDLFVVMVRRHNMPDVESQPLYAFEAGSGK